MSRLLRGKNVAEGFFSKDIDKTVDLVYNGGKKKRQAAVLAIRQPCTEVKRALLYNRKTGTQGIL